MRNQAARRQAGRYARLNHDIGGAVDESCGLLLGCPQPQAAACWQLRGGCTFQCCCGVLGPMGLHAKCVAPAPLAGKAGGRGRCINYVLMPHGCGPQAGHTSTCVRPSLSERKMLAAAACQLPSSRSATTPPHLGRRQGAAVGRADSAALRPFLVIAGRALMVGKHAGGGVHGVHW